MQQCELDLFGNPIETPTTTVVADGQSRKLQDNEFYTLSDQWRNRCDPEEPERWDGMS